MMMEWIFILLVAHKKVLDLYTTWTTPLIKKLKTQECPYLTHGVLGYIYLMILWKCTSSRISHKKHPRVFQLPEHNGTPSEQIYAVWILCRVGDFGNLSIWRLHLLLAVYMHLHLLMWNMFYKRGILQVNSSLCTPDTNTQFHCNSFRAPSACGTHPYLTWYLDKAEQVIFGIQQIFSTEHFICQPMSECASHMQ